MTKNFIVKVERSHESYNGYDHIDDISDYKVKARDEKSARKKALTVARSSGGGYSYRTLGCELILVSC